MLSFVNGIALNTLSQGHVCLYSLSTWIKFQPLSLYFSISLPKKNEQFLHFRLFLVQFRSRIICSRKSCMRKALLKPRHAHLSYTPLAGRTGVAKNERGKRVHSRGHKKKIVFNFHRSLLLTRDGSTTFRKVQKMSPNSRSVFTRQSKASFCMSAGPLSSAVTITPRLAEHLLSLHLAQAALGLLDLLDHVSGTRVSRLQPNQAHVHRPPVFAYRSAQSSLKFCTGVICSG